MAAKTASEAKARPTTKKKLFKEKTKSTTEI